MIFGNFWSRGSTAALLLHAMPKTKESWTDFATKLFENDWSILAIDERGHGESNEGGSLDWKNFSPEDQQKKILDVAAADEWLVDQEKKLELIAGASIGANLALNYMTDKKITSGVILSAGFDYRGVRTQAPAQKLIDPQRVFYAGAKLDTAADPNCAEIAQKLYELSSISDKKLYISNGPAHGTDMFETDPELEKQILGWV